MKEKPTVHLVLTEALSFFEAEMLQRESMPQLPFPKIPGLSVVHSPCGGDSLYYAVLAAGRLAVAMNPVALRQQIIEQASVCIMRIAGRRRQDPFEILNDLLERRASVGEIGMYFLSQILRANIEVHCVGGVVKKWPCDAAVTDTIYLQYNGAHYDALVPALSLVWSGKYGKSIYTPIVQILLGSAITEKYTKAKTKAMAVVPCRDWFGKLVCNGGMDFFPAFIEEDEGLAIKRSAICEEIANRFYTILGSGKYETAKVRLADLPIENEVNKGYPLVEGMITLHKDQKRAVRVMSREIEGYQNLKELTGCVIAGLAGEHTFLECLMMGRLPDVVRYEGKEYPVSGIAAMLAVGVAIGDIDVLGGSAANAGFSFSKNAAGDVTHIEFHKIDPGFGFAFTHINNVLHWNAQRMAEHNRDWQADCIASDKPFVQLQVRDIQFGSNLTRMLILWDSLSDAHKCEFLETLSAICKRLKDDDVFLDYIIRRNGEFEHAGAGVWREREIEELKTGIRKNVARILSDEVYGIALRDHHAAHPARVPNSQHSPRFFVPTSATGLSAACVQVSSPSIDAHSP